MKYNANKLHKLVENENPYNLAMKIQELEAENKRLVKRNEVLTDVIEFVENRAKLLIGVLEEDGERSYTGFVKEIKNRAQKALEGK